jgi:hypothetical protein
MVRQLRDVFVVVCEVGGRLWHERRDRHPQMVVLTPSSSQVVACRLVETIQPPMADCHSYARVSVAIGQKKPVSAEVGAETTVALAVLQTREASTLKLGGTLLYQSAIPHSVRF